MIAPVKAEASQFTSSGYLWFMVTIMVLYAIASGACSKRHFFTLADVKIQWFAGYQNARYSSSKKRKVQNEHLNIVCQNLNGL